LLQVCIFVFTDIAVLLRYAICSTAVKILSALQQKYAGNSIFYKRSNRTFHAIDDGLSQMYKYCCIVMSGRRKTGVCQKRPLTKVLQSKQRLYANGNAVIQNKDCDKHLTHNSLPQRKMILQRLKQTELLNAVLNNNTSALQKDVCT